MLARLFEQEFGIARFNLNPGTLGTPSRSVRAALAAFEEEERGAWPLGQYKEGRQAIQSARRLAMELWGEAFVAIGPGTTLYTALVFHALIGWWRKRRHFGKIQVLTTDQEHEGGGGNFIHHSELQVRLVDEPIQEAVEQGRLDEFARLATGVELVFLSQVRWTDGRALPVERMIQIVREVAPEAWIILDAAQVVGLDQPLLPGVLGPDLTVASGHKWLCGPAGTGFLWVGARAREELGGICPIGHPLDTDSPVGGFEPGGGQDFARFVGLEAALKLYQQLGLKAARAQSFKLASQLAAGLSEIFSEVEHQLLPSSPGMVAIRFDRLDPYPLYQKLEANKVHVKCIKGATPSGLWLNQLRFGVPWYETPARLEQALSIIRSQYAAG